MSKIEAFLMAIMTLFWAYMFFTEDVLLYLSVSILFANVTNLYVKKEDSQS